MSKLDGIADHLTNNLRNRFLRQALQTMQLTSQEWSLVDSVSEKAEYFKVQGYHFDELYDRVHALGRFVNLAKRQLRPKLRSLLHESSQAGRDRVIREMTINNFSSNIDVLADLIMDLFVHALRIDEREHPGGDGVYKTHMAFRDIEDLIERRLPRDDE